MAAYSCKEAAQKLKELLQDQGAALAGIGDMRLSSLLTDAPLECDTPNNQSNCGGCNLCVSNCPAQALKGTLWNPEVTRAEIVDIPKCYQKQVEIMTKATGIETDLCGKCFAVCAYTRKYIATQK